jgi:hypothetical protein
LTSDALRAMARSVRPPIAEVNTAGNDIPG